MYQPGIDNNNQIVYLKMKANQLLNLCKKYVTLQIDEIHVQAGFITKVAPTKALHNTNTETHIVQAFFICSISGSLKEMAALVPMRNITASDLADLLPCVINLVRAKYRERGGYR